MIHWFPGHMHKAKKELQKIINQNNIAIEVVDARCPEASTNQALEYIAKGLPIIKILSKSDLADPIATKKWLAHYKGKAIAMDIPNEKRISSKIISLARTTVPHRGTFLKPIKIVVFGIPNVGKSTLINALAKRKIAKTGNEPAVTKNQQKVTIEKGVLIMDTPGIMSPTPKNEESGYILGITGSIRDTAMDYIDASFYFIEYMKKNYIHVLKARYNVDANQDNPESILNDIANKLGNYSQDQAAKKILHDFRNGSLGKISLETPDNFIS